MHPGRGATGPPRCTVGRLQAVAGFPTPRRAFELGSELQACLIWGGRPDSPRRRARLRLRPRRSDWASIARRLLCPPRRLMCPPRRLLCPPRRLSCPRAARPRAVAAHLPWHLVTAAARAAPELPEMTISDRAARDRAGGPHSHRRAPTRSAGRRAERAGAGRRARAAARRPRPHWPLPPRRRRSPQRPHLSLPRASSRAPCASSWAAGLRREGSVAAPWGARSQAAGRVWPRAARSDWRAATSPQSSHRARRRSAVPAGPRATRRSGRRSRARGGARVHGARWCSLRGSSRAACVRTSAPALGARAGRPRRCSLPPAHARA